MKGVNKYMDAVLGARLPHTIVGNKVIIHDTALGEHLDGEFRELVEENERLRRELHESRASHTKSLDTIMNLQHRIESRNKLINKLRPHTFVSI